MSKVETWVAIRDLKFLAPRQIPHPLRRPAQTLAQQRREDAVEDRERARRAVEARGVELERPRRRGRDDRRRAREVDEDAHLADDLTRPEVREHDRALVAAAAALHAALPFEDEVDRHRRLALGHQRLARRERAHRAEPDDEHERARIERGEARTRAEGLQDLGFVQLGSDCPTGDSLAWSRSLSSRAMIRWRIG